MAVKLSALRTRRTLPPRNIIIFNVSGTHFCWRLSKPQGLVRPEGLGKFKKFTSSGIEPVTFRLVAQCLNHYATAYPSTTHFQDQIKFCKFPSFFFLIISNFTVSLRHPVYMCKVYGIFRSKVSLQPFHFPSQGLKLKLPVKCDCETNLTHPHHTLVFPSYYQFLTIQNITPAFPLR
jgi:hypothetical protein